MALNITAAQHVILDTYSQAGDYVGGWSYLASIGDNYADNAAAVTSGNATGVVDKAFEVLVKNHWENIAPGTYATKFDDVAKQHFQQYVAAITPANNYKLPDSRG